MIIADVLQCELFLDDLIYDNERVFMKLFYQSLTSDILINN